MQPELQQQQPLSLQLQNAAEKRHREAAETASWSVATVLPNNARQEQGRRTPEKGFELSFLYLESSLLF